MLRLWRSYYRDKVVLITGASAGIGEALAYEATKCGARLALGARRIDRLKTLRMKLPNPENVFVGDLDVTSRRSTEDFVSATIATFGAIDVVIVNAGFAVSGDFERLSTEDYRRQFETNVFGALETLRSTLPHLKKSSGRLATIGSVNSYISFAGTSPYSMSKYALRALTESLYHELKPEGIKVTLICPGMVESEIRQVDNQGRLHADSPDPVPEWIVMRRDVAARKILKAISNGRRELVVTLHGKVGVWLQRHFPGILHGILNALGIRAGKHKSVKAQMPT